MQIGAEIRSDLAAVAHRNRAVQSPFRPHEPEQGGDLQGDVDGECGLIGGGRIMIVVGRPSADDEPDAGLQHEGAADMEEIKRGVGASSDFNRKNARREWRS